MRVILVVLLTIAAPIKGQGNGTKADAQTKDSQNVESSNTSSRSVGVVKQQAPDSNKNQSAAKPDNYLHHLLLPETLADIVLAIVGIVGICVTIKTLKAIQRQALIMIQQARIFTRQAKASEDAIIAAKASSDILANIERAWVNVRLTMQDSSIYFIEITNFGRTVADIQRIVTEYSLIKEGAEPPHPPWVPTIHRKSKLLVPNQPWPALIVNLDGDFGTGVLQKLRNGEMRFSYRVSVHYAGIRPDCRSECLYFWKNSGTDGRLMPVEAPEYNPHT